MTDAMEEHAESLFDTEPSPQPTALSPAPPVAAPSAPQLSDTIADDVEHELDPGFVEFARIICWIITACVSFSLLWPMIVGVIFAPRWAGALAVAGWIVITLLLVWMSLRWPLFSYRYSSYRVSARGIEIREGVWWRQVTHVPRSRIQHTDVSQGPLERQFGLSTLVIHTAGAENSVVTLHGLAHPTAMRIRDYLLTGGEDDGV